MTDLDNAIHETLSREDAEFLERFDKEPGSFKQIFGIYSGPFAWMSILFTIVVIPLAFASLYAAWTFTQVEDIREMLLWGGGALLGFLIMIVVRMWFFMQIQTNRVLREVKRVELQVARMISNQTV